MTPRSLQNSSRCQLALDRLTQLHPKLIDLGLERTLALSEKMGAPHLSLPPTIHIAGTNGKGSTAAIVRSLLEANGYKVHVYSSPHLCRFNERIRLAGKLISDEALADLLERIEQVNGDNPITFFESTTVAGLTAFAEHPADFLILETGLGGVFDSTNIITEHACSIITPIAYDHEHFLGTNLGEIALQKAGIMKPDCPTIWAIQDHEAQTSLKNTADDITIGSLSIEGEDFSTQSMEDNSFTYHSAQHDIKLIQPALIGAHQIQNAGLALRCLEVLGITFDANCLHKGMQNTVWPARVQKLESGKLLAQSTRSELWLDGAHNAHGAKALAEAMAQLAKPLQPEQPKWIMVFGTLNTRPAADFLKQMRPLIDTIYTLTIPDQPASYDGTELRDIAVELGINAQACNSLEEAMQRIAADKDNTALPVMICGSLYLGGYVLAQNQTLPT